MVNTWVRLPRCLGFASSSVRRGCDCCWPGWADSRDDTYFRYSGAFRNWPAQSVSGVSAKAWNTSAQSSLAKYFRPSAGGPK